MFALMRLSEGLLVAHLCIGLAYLIGSNATQWDRHESSGAADAMVRIVCTCALGFAFIGFGAFVLAALHLFTAYYAAALFVVLFVAGAAASKTSPFSGSYWAARRNEIFDALDAPHAIVYYGMLVVAFPAVNAANVGADALAYHWAYATDWIHAHGLVIDPFLREPFYAQNDLLLVALDMLFGGTVFAQFLMWMMGALSALGICAGVRSAFRSGGAWPAAVGVLLAGAAIYSPGYLRWMDSGYLDAALGFFALAAVLALRLGVQEDTDSRWLAVCAVVAAFLIGSKSSLLPFIPVYGVVLFFAARVRKLSVGRTTVLLLTLVALAVPWYVRNFILAGDVIPPVLNIIVFGHDGLFTKAELQGIASDLHTHHDPLAIASMPFRAFFEPDTHDFREYAVSALMLFLYVPTIAVFFARFVFNRKIAPAVTYPVLVLTITIAYWIASSTIIRYSLIFYPMLALCCGLLAGTLGAPIKRSGPALAIVAALALLITPTAEAHTFYKNYFINGVVNPAQYYESDRLFLNQFIDGYKEEQFATHLLRRLKARGRLYLLGNNIAYYYRRDGVQSIGDWVGPAGYFRFFRAVSTGNARAFLGGLGVDAVLIDPAQALGGLAVPIERQLRSAGYCSVSIPDSRMKLLLRVPQSCAVVQKAATAS